MDQKLNVIIPTLRKKKKTRNFARLTLRQKAEETGQGFVKNQRNVQQSLSSRDKTKFHGWLSKRTTFQLQSLILQPIWHGNEKWKDLHMMLGDLFACFRQTTRLCQFSKLIFRGFRENRESFTLNNKVFAYWLSSCKSRRLQGHRDLKTSSNTDLRNNSPRSRN